MSEFRFSAHTGQAIIFRDKSLDVAATSSYLAEFMSDPLATLAIENIQYIDDRSLLILLNIIEQTRGGNWILEYTISEGGHSLDGLMERFRSSGASVHSVELINLPWVELRRAFAGQMTSCTLSPQFMMGGTATQNILG
jgi:hypothetical protein